MGLSESIRALKMIRPKNVIPMHYDPGLNLEDWKREVIETSGAKPIVLRSGESFDL
jgi:L-ascorbate metabolism protein UlaG (beta-lactamase superfamily)